MKFVSGGKGWKAAGRFDPSRRIDDLPAISAVGVPGAPVMGSLMVSAVLRCHIMGLRLALNPVAQIGDFLLELGGLFGIRIVPGHQGVVFTVLGGQFFSKWRCFRHKLLGIRCVNSIIALSPVPVAMGAIAGEVVDNLPVGLLVTDDAGKIILENEAAAAITGLASQDVRLKAAERVLPEILSRLMGPGQKDTRVIEREIECRFGENDPVSLSVSAAAIVNADGDYIGSLMIFRDLTEIKALEQAVQRKEKLAAIGGLAAGIAHSDLNQIFDPYFTTKSAGTGLGLAIVHKIVENHGGKIFVKSTPEKGTVFTIRLPICCPDHPAPHQPAPDQPASDQPGPDPYTDEE